MRLPKIRQTDGYTSIDTKVKCSHGIGQRTARQIVEEANKYLHDIFLIDETQSQYDAKEMLDLTKLDAEKGSDIEIKVGGTDELSKQIALRFYSALTSKNSFNLDFEKYSNAQ